MRVSCLLAALLLAGCAGPAPAPSVEAGASCEERFAGPRGENAVLVAPLQDPPDVAMERLLALVGDAPVGSPEAHADALRWRTEMGWVEHARDDAGVRLAWTPEAAWTPPEGLLARVLDAFQAQADVSPDGAQALQAWRGEPLSRPGAMLRSEPPSVVVGPLYEFDPRATPLDAAALQARADEVALCLGAEAARAGALDVVAGSLARAFDAGGARFQLDAETASLLAVLRPG